MHLSIACPTVSPAHAMAHRAMMVLCALLCVAALVCSGCASGTSKGVQWTQPSSGVLLGKTWGDAASGLSIDASVPVSTRMTIVWGSDGSLFRLELQSKLPGSTQVNVGTARGADAQAVTVMASRYDVGGGDVSPLAAGVPVADILSSIDSVGYQGLLTATAILVEEDEGLILRQVSPVASPPSGRVMDYTHGTAALQLCDGATISLDQSVPLASLSPVSVFALWKARVKSNTASGIGPPLAYCFVR